MREVRFCEERRVADIYYTPSRAEKGSKEREMLSPGLFLSLSLFAGCEIGANRLRFARRDFHPSSPPPPPPPAGFYLSGEKFWPERYLSGVHGEASGAAPRPFPGFRRARFNSNYAFLIGG